MTGRGQLSRWADLGSAQDFDRRYSRDSVDVWVSRLAGLGPIGAGDLVLDLGCDLSATFVRYAGGRDSPVRWLVADAQAVPLADGSVDCAIMSLLLHRLPDPAQAVAEARRLLRPGGSLLIKTVLPADAAGSLPYRLFPTVAAAQLARLPGLSMITNWLSAAGFGEVTSERVLRDRRIDAERLASTAVVDAKARYPDLDGHELRQGLRRLQEESALHSGNWTEQRGTALVRAAAS
ncbi:class I SAM-dependent methyltransferase [Microlunatus parietis]|uniref:SAM-dependent methyltransferase n=1 Tax=Microlunatus parietis TaxID=682979 RepID=A0A7Y9I4U3_9ACTN|nr:class I SAM-dependent methyltransferase [Microlunatus parietis]NYE70118.1 SAM-dependent methyltransferase [Microlunatus parietis]